MRESRYFTHRGGRTVSPGAPCACGPVMMPDCRCKVSEVGRNQDFPRMTSLIMRPSFYSAAYPSEGRWTSGKPIGARGTSMDCNKTIELNKWVWECMGVKDSMYNGVDLD